MGRINGVKLAAALGTSLLAFGATGVAVAQGGLTANLALSGTFFTVSMTHLTGEDFALFMDSEDMAGDNIPVARLRFGHALASNLCLSATLPSIPGVGEGTLQLIAAGDGSVEVTDLLVGASDIEGSLNLTDAAVGIDASQVIPSANVGAWGLHSNGVTLSAEKIRATAVGAKKLSAKGVTVSVKKGRENAC
ncbi:DUF6230 family protein [Corynebacterium sp. HMSC29G08]|uniref:DUF6230 family protein n=1 Tax=Corynebacterium sp. HMSC29G08 TaxID=1581069 RepID=UPI0008A57136|nr:DUF6230 family protein [Corynebacterium sp. HMSC29G08]OFT85511.1 cholesterol esterase [Corynebacterium sp. HMSC29G08]